MQSIHPIDASGARITALPVQSSAASPSAVRSLRVGALPARFEESRNSEFLRFENVPQVWGVFRINLEDNSSSCHVTRESFNFKSSHSARRAPRGPEINKHRDSIVPSDAIKYSSIYVDGLLKW